MTNLQPLLPFDAWNRAVFATFLLLWGISCIQVPYPKYFWMQHVRTVAAIIALVFAEQKLAISRVSFTLIITFLMLHLLGARYLYSYVPYDYWSKQLFGMNITTKFDFTRNHYDRVVHFCFGAMIVVPSWRFSGRLLRLNPLPSAACALTIILASSAAYEIFEWSAAMVMAPDWAESYNGQQGDAWDAQRDMALAAVGALLGLLSTVPWWRSYSGRVTVGQRLQ